MRKTANLTCLGILLTVALLLSLIPSVSVSRVSAHPGKMTWSIVDTPSTENNIIASPSEVNVIALGFDDRTFYAVDIPNSTLHKSTDGGVTWLVELGGNLTTAGANLPVWNLAVAPDDVNFLVAVTDETGVPGGPRRVLVSTDGGASWQNTNFPLPLPEPPLAANEFISCVDISVAYGNSDRDIAIGSRNNAGTGRVWVLKTGVESPGWVNQGLPASDVVALKFSPTYTSDSSLVVISSFFAADTRLHLGYRDTDANITHWNMVGGYPVLIHDGIYAGTSPVATDIITADVELPSDFSGTDPNFRRFYVSTDATAAGVQSGVYRVDSTVAYWIKPPTTAPTTGRISSIAYYGTYAEGVLLAGEVTVGALAPNPVSYGAYVWRTSNPNETVGTPTWLSSDTRKSPTGGFGSGFANAQVAWSSEGTWAYCGTSSANPTLGGTSWVVGQWPRAWTNVVPFDESAFSVSPYAPGYGQLLVSFSKAQDTDIGNIWNQLSLIDTRMTPSSFLSDVAALGVPEIGEELVLEDYDILYLASVDDTGGLDSIWRSTSDPLGRTWERVLCIATTNDDIILRVKQTNYEETDRNEVIVFADRGTNVVSYSVNEGQIWDVSYFTAVTDLALAEEDVIYILNNTDVYRYENEGTGWMQTNKVNTQLGSGHTIAVPLKNPEEEGGTPEDWVIVGEAGVLSGMGGVAWADFSQTPVSFKPPFGRWIEVPVRGNVHVIADDRFEQTKIVYAATNNAAGDSGKIYRWAIDKSTDWDELEPPNSAFYGLAQRNDVLYGAWISPQVPAITSDTGVDRTIYPRLKVPPPTEWDYMTSGLPAGVVFTREPSSLKISSNEDNSLWAIDNRAYDWPNGTGCLWAYADTVAKVGPWTTSPASGDSISVDPVTGRAIEIDFKWRQLSYASAYELQLAKDSDFNIVVLRNENIVPVDQLAPECYFPAGGLVPTPSSAIAGFGNLESGHVYYWRVRGRVDVAGESVRSPWSATMYFTVGAGFPVMAEYPTVTLFSPTYGARGVSRSPAFSWSPMFKTAKYEFVLAKDAALQQVIVKTNVSQTAYMYDDQLDFNTNYFWQVRAIEPVVSDPSPIGTFTVVAEEKPAEPAIEKPTPIPFWVWGVIALYAILVVAMITFAVVKPRYIRPRAAPVDKLDLAGDKPQNPIAGIRNVMTMGVKRSAAPVDKLDLADDKPQNPIARIWNAITMGVRRRRYLGKRGGGGLDDLE